LKTLPIIVPVESCLTGCRGDYRKAQHDHRIARGGVQTVATACLRRESA
jgi:hypothetical protein